MAPIEEDMLLGLDFLEANGVSLHLKEKELQISGDVIPMSLGTGSPLVNEKEAGVFLAKGCKVPPNSVMRVGAQLSESMAGEYIVKAATKGELLIPWTLHNGGDNPVLCLINISDHYVEVCLCRRGVFERRDYRSTKGRSCGIGGSREWKTGNSWTFD